MPSNPEPDPALITQEIPEPAVNQVDAMLTALE